MNEGGSANDSLQVDRHRSVVRLVLNRPDVMNALDQDLVARLGRSLDSLGKDSAARAVVLTGSGRAFCAGSDVKAMGTRVWRGDLDGTELDTARTAERARMADAFENVVRLTELPMPTIAALRGAVAGGGLGLAIACDLRVASTTTTFSTAYARLGLPGDWGVTLLLPELVGRQRARRLLLSTSRISADEALAMGLVDEVVEDDELDDRALALASEFAQGPTAAYAGMKRLLLVPGLRNRLVDEIEATLDCQETSDHQEGLASLLERRPPTFQGT